MFRFAEGRSDAGWQLHAEVPSGHPGLRRSSCQAVSAARPPRQEAVAAPPQPLLPHPLPRKRPRPHPHLPLRSTPTHCHTSHWRTEPRRRTRTQSCWRSWRPPCRKTTLLLCPACRRWKFRQRRSARARVSHCRPRWRASGTCTCWAATTSTWPRTAPAPAALASGRCAHASAAPSSVPGLGVAAIAHVVSGCLARHHEHDFWRKLGRCASMRLCLEICGDLGLGIGGMGNELLLLAEQAYGLLFSC